MAKHKYDGTWRYFENPDGGEDKFSRREDMILAIPTENGDVDKAHSSHNGEEISGKARNNGVTLSRQGTGNTRTLNGVTMFEIPLGSGQVFAVIKGRYRDDPKDRAPLTQNEGDWVITKP